MTNPHSSESREDAIGPITLPEEVLFTSELPKTRSGKIMRRLLEDVASGEELGDTSTLRNPVIVDEIAAQVDETDASAAKVDESDDTDSDSETDSDDGDTNAAHSD